MNDKAPLRSDTSVLDTGVNYHKRSTNHVLLAKSYELPDSVFALSPSPFPISVWISGNQKTKGFPLHYELTSQRPCLDVTRLFSRLE